MPCLNSSTTSVCGWAELMDGNLIGSAFRMLDYALLGWTVIILFFVFHVMLYVKTKNLTITFITGIIFLSLYVSSTLMNVSGTWVISVLLIMELGGILFMSFVKK